jgi:AcrR family transcriptional regulator
MAKQAERRAATRSAILEAAAKLFRKRGFNEVAVEDITASADVAKGTFYQHFNSKNEILLALMHCHEAAALQAVEDKLAAGVPPLELGRGLALGMAQSFEKDRKMAGQAVALAMAQPPKAGGPSLRAAFARIFAEAQRLREIRTDVDSYELALMLMGAMLPQILLWIAEQGKKGGLAPRLQRVWQVFLEGLGT